MTPQELYKSAQNAHYKHESLDEARELYERIIVEFPESAEAEYSQQQIDVLGDASTPPNEDSGGQSEEGRGGIPGVSPISCLFIIIILVGGFIGLTRQASEPRAASSPSNTSGSAARVQPTPTTPRMETIVLSGRGDDVVTISKPNVAVMVQLSHSGSSNFIVTAWDGERRQGLVNEIGVYQGVVALDFLDHHTDEIEIQADGAWHMEVKSLALAPIISDSKSGEGDAILRVASLPSSANITHNGQSNFMVRAWGDGGLDGMVNEIGNYDGRVRTPSGVIVLEIIADGQWSISP